MGENKPEILGVKTTKTELKNSTVNFNNRVDQVEGWTNELKKTSIEVTQLEEQKGRGIEEK